MTSDDQHFLDMLSSIPNDVKKYSLDIADAIDRQIDAVAGVVRDSLSNQAWLPQSVRPPPTPSPPRIPGPPPTLIEQAQEWVLAHRAWTAAFFAFMGTGGFLIYRQRRFYGRKRKARKAGNGARKEIVVIGSSPHEAMARSIAHDLERKGFIVFITAGTPEEEQLVLREAKPDIRPLYVDITSATPSPNDLHPSLHQLHSLITQPQYPTPGASQPHTCHFSGLILIPSLSYPNGPVGMIPPSTWADTLNTRLLSPVLITQIFLPLMSSNKNNSSTIVLLTPSIPSSLDAPFNSPEVLVTRGLEGWASSLRRELLISSNNTNGSIDVVQLKVGHINLEPTMCRSTSTEMLSWNPSRGSYSSSPKPLVRRHPAENTGSPVNVLHNAVFDAVAMNTRSGRIYGKRRRVVYVGKGSWTYSIIGSWVPGGFIGWMLGFGVGHGVWRTGDESRSEGWEKV